MKKNILIAYYSWHGNTKKIAELISSETGGGLFQVEPVEKYTTDYSAAVTQAKKEIQAGFQPEIKAVPENNSSDIIFFGSPIWWYTMAPPMATLITSLDLKGKTIVPFHTHGGGGVGTFEKDIKNMCPDSIVTEGIGFCNDGGSDAKIKIVSWLSYLGL